MIDTYGDDYKKLFNHSERLSSKAYLYSSGSNLIIIYVNTVVFELMHNRIILNTDGWETMTSKKWINKGCELINSDLYIQQKNHEWFVSNWTSDKKIKFVDNMGVLLK